MSVLHAQLTPILRQNLHQMVQHLDAHIQQLGYQAIVHFELEGVAEWRDKRQVPDFISINKRLKQLGIAGELKAEYWSGQWEYVSDFSGQTPCEEANYLYRAMQILPELLCQHGAEKVWLKPVIWQGDKGRYLSGSNAIFAQDDRAVHIPNAIQVNISINDAAGNNLIANTHLGECLQHCLLETSYANCLLFLPEEEAFRRLTLRRDYDLNAELSSPWQLSGGHQGSVALFRKIGKHNQPLGQQTLLVDDKGESLSVIEGWQKTARVEHRLGATSLHYDPFINMLFMLLNVLNAIEKYQSGEQLNPYSPTSLPESLWDKSGKKGAITLFEQSSWLTEQIDRYCDSNSIENLVSFSYRLKQALLDYFSRMHRS
jgi:hypothetical protein